MIIDLIKFINQEKPFWNELEEMLKRFETNPDVRLNLSQIQRFYYLYQRASGDLARLQSLTSEQNIRRYLESLVASAYGEIHEQREKPYRFAPMKWFFNTFPKTVQCHIRIFCLSAAVFMAGCIFGGLAIGLDPNSKEVLMPFSHLQQHPSDRVAEEEKADTDHLKGQKAAFSSWLMTHNTKVSILALALGVTWGIGTVLLLFTNGVMLGAVAADYMIAGESKFLAGWLLPHGSVEIPAILLAAQAGLILAHALIGWGSQPVSLTQRLRIISSDLVTLIGGVSIMLVWAGIIESFFSQYHEPILPYEVKIGFGLAQLIVLGVFLFGRKS